MSLEAVTRNGRELAERNMLDTCLVRNVTGSTTDGDGNVVPTYSTAYTGKAKVQTFEAYEQAKEVGGFDASIQRYSLHVPVGSFRPEIGQFVVMTACALDPNLVGREFRVVALLHKTASTAYRLGIEEGGPDGFSV